MGYSNYVIFVIIRWQKKHKTWIIKEVISLKKVKKKMINEKTNKLWVENIIVGGDWSEEDA